MHRFANLIFGCLVSIYGGQIAEAATFSQSARKLCHIELHGEIALDDVRGLEQAVKVARERISRKPVVERLPKDHLPRFLAEEEIPVLCLNSKGGNFAGALRIVKYMLGSGGIGTVVDAEQECLSACALVFMFGHIELYHGDKFFDRRLHTRGRLGLHAPFINARTAADKEAVALSYSAGVRAVAQLIEIDRNEFLTRGLIIDFLKAGPKNFVWVDTVGRAGEWTIELIGVRDPKMTRGSIMQACDNQEAWDERRKTREFDIGKYVPKDTSRKNETITLKGGKAVVRLKGYGAEGGGECITKIQDHGKGNVALALDIVTDDATLKESVELKELNVPFGPRLLVTPGFGAFKPLWIQHAPSTKLRSISAVSEIK